MEMSNKKNGEFDHPKTWKSQKSLGFEATIHAGYEMMTSSNLSKWDFKQEK
jgi:hypothetical protein